MLKTIRNLKLIGITILLTFTFVRPSYAENLWDIYKKALLNDASYKQQQFLNQADKEFDDQAYSALRPQLDLSGGLGRIKDDIDTEFESTSGEATYTNTNAALSLSQTLWDKYKFENLQQAKNQVYLSDTRLESAKLNLLERTATAYFNQLASEDVLRVALRQQRAFKEQYDQASSRLDVGLGTSTDFYQTNSQYKLAQVDVLNAENAISDAKQALEEIIGEKINYPLAKPIDDYPIIDPEPNDLQAWLTIALENNYDLSVAQQQSEISLQEIEIARSGHWPTLELGAQRVFNDNDGGVSGEFESDQTRVFLQLAVPIYQGGLIQSQSREAAQRYNASLENVNIIKRNISRRVDEAWHDVLTSKKRISALSDALKAAENTLDARNNSFDNGLSTNFEVLDATRELYEAQRDYLQSRYDYIISLFNLKSLAGILNEQDFETVSNLLE